MTVMPDEVGCSLTPVLREIEANIVFRPFVVLTMGSMAFSLFWPKRYIGFAESVRFNCNGSGLSI